jgi:ribosome biogenesis ATPase
MFCLLLSVISVLTPAQVYQVVRKIIDDNPDVRLSVPMLYDQIKKSNSSLKRQQKRSLEDSLERVLAVLQADEVDDEEDTVEGDFDGLDEAPATVCKDLKFCSVHWYINRNG